MIHSTINWDEAYARGKDYVAISPASLSDVLDKLPTNAESALDIGCGTGQVCRDLFHRGFDVVGLDLSGEAIKQAKESTEYLGKGVNFIQGNIENSNIIKGKRDLIICKYTYAFLKDKSSFLKNVVSIMNEKSLFVIISPSPQSVLGNKKHITVDRKDILRKLSPYFSSVDFAEQAHDDYYFCQL